MTDHPIRALGDMLTKAAKPARLTWCQFLDRRGISADQYRIMEPRLARALTQEWMGQAIPGPVFNINSLDENDPRGVEDVIDVDRVREIRAGLDYVKPSGGSDT